jgi:hypothetical protein
MPERTPLVVVGLGRSVDGDDGLGAAAVALLTQTYDVPDGIHVTAGRLPPVDGAPAMILVGAIESSAPAGTFVRLAGPAAEAMRLLPRGWREDDGSRPPTPLIALGLVPSRVDRGAGLSRPVAAGLRGLVRHIVVEARRLGHDLRPRRATPAAA